MNSVSDKSKHFPKGICKWPIGTLKDVQHHSPARREMQINIIRIYYFTSTRMAILTVRQ